MMRLDYETRNSPILCACRPPPYGAYPSASATITGLSVRVGHGKSSRCLAHDERLSLMQELVSIKIAYSTCFDVIRHIFHGRLK